MLGRVPVEQPELDRPVDLGVDQAELVLPHGAQRPLPQVEDPVDDDGAEILPPDELGDLLVVLGLQFQRGDPPPVGERHLHLAGTVPAHVPDRPDRVLQGEVAHRDAGLDQPQHQFRRADLQQRRRLAHVGVTDDDVQAPVALRIGVRLVAGVDDRPAPGGRRRHALPDVLGPLADAVLRTPRGVQHLAGARRSAAGRPGTAPARR